MISKTSMGINPGKKPGQNKSAKHCARGFRAVGIARLLTGFLLLGMVNLPAFAKPTPGLENITKDASSSFFAPPVTGISLKQATAIARKHTGGRVLSADPRKRGDKVEYKVRMLVDGERVVTLVVDDSGHVRNRR